MLLMGALDVSIDFQLTLLVRLPVILKLPESVPGLAAEAVVEKNDHFLAHLCVHSRIGVHAVHEAYASSQPGLIRVLSGVRFYETYAPRVIPRAPLVLVALLQKSAHVFVRLLIQIVHEEHLAPNSRVRTHFLLLSQIYQVFEQPDFDNVGDDMTLETPHIEHLVPLSFLFKPQLDCSELLAQFFSFSGRNIVLIFGDLLWLADRLVLEVEHLRISSHILLGEHLELLFAFSELGLDPADLVVCVLAQELVPKVPYFFQPLVVRFVLVRSQDRQRVGLQLVARAQRE
mmetsp:Transcript_6475/g.7755  ORF Transcript_6475/g.7755 Transcript_6475/m.7755 type:complete len:287 (+) Transcript_6475:1143-2003(+)